MLRETADNVGSSPSRWAYTYRIANFSLGGVDIGKESVNRLSTLNSLRPTVLEAYFINLMNRLDLRSYTTSASPKLGGVDLPASTVQLEIQIRWPRSPGRSVAGRSHLESRIEGPSTRVGSNVQVFLG